MLARSICLAYPLASTGMLMDREAMYNVKGTLDEMKKKLSRHTILTEDLVFLKNFCLFAPTVG